MQETKLKIDINQGLLEVEGSEELVREIYSDFKDILKTRPHGAPVAAVMDDANISAVQPSGTVKTKSKPKPKVNAKSKSSSDITGTLLKDLNLMNDGSTESLRDFFRKYEAKTNLERTLIFVYYLEQLRGISGININHVFTCYRNIDGLKIPGHLKQNIADTSSKKRWLDTTDMEDIKVPVTGVNYIEHDLPKKDGSE